MSPAARACSGSRATLPVSKRTIVDRDRFGALTAYGTRHVVYGAERRAIPTHSLERARGLDGTTP